MRTLERLGLHQSQSEDREELVRLWQDELTRRRCRCAVLSIREQDFDASIGEVISHVAE